MRYLQYMGMCVYMYEHWQGEAKCKSAIEQGQQKQIQKRSCNKV